MESYDKFKRPRAMSCPRPNMGDNQKYQPDPWLQRNSYFRACFDQDLGPGDEDSDLEDMIAGVKGTDYSMSTSRAADDVDDDEEDDENPSHCQGRLGTERAGVRKLRSSTDGNVNFNDASFDDGSSERRGGRFDESRFEQDYLDDFESSSAESVVTNSSFASSSRRRKGGAQGVDDETDAEEEIKQEIQSIKTESVVENKDNEHYEEDGHEERLMGVQVLDPDPPDEYLEEGMDTVDSQKIESKMTIRKSRLKNRRVLIRTDLNVPIQDGEILNTEKIESALPTIKYVIDSGAKSVVLMSHIGHPEGQVDLALSLRPVAAELESRLEGQTVTFLEDCVGKDVEEACADPIPGSVFLLENLRFHPEEEGKGMDEEGQEVVALPEEVHEFRESLRKLGDIYINDDFDTVNREHSSVVGVDLQERVAGFHLEEEVNKFTKIIENPQLPYLAIVGCNVGEENLPEKLELIDHLMDSLTDVIIAGDVALTFLKVLNDMEIGATPFDDALAELVPHIYHKAGARNVRMHFPVDFVVADQSVEDAEPGVADVETGIPEDNKSQDIGEKSVELFVDVISRANTIVWTGPPGQWESESFQESSKSMTAAIKEAVERGVPVILADPETVNCAEKYDLDLHTVMWGGASMDMLEGKVLPGVAHLSDLPKLRADWHVRPMRTCRLANQRVGLRLDLDVLVHTDDEGHVMVTDQGIPKLVSAATTVNKALRMGAKSVVIFSHRGNPKGLVDPNLSMKPVALGLEKLLERPVTLVEDCVGETARAQCVDPWPGSVFTLENLRFHPEEQGLAIERPSKRSRSSNKDSAIEEGVESVELGEADLEQRNSGEAEIKEEKREIEEKGEVTAEGEMEENAEEVVDETTRRRSTKESFNQSVQSSTSEKSTLSKRAANFRADLSRLVDVYIMDDVSGVDLPHSSTSGVMAPVMVCGPHIEQELKFMADKLQTPDRPVVAVLGGDTIQEKFDLISGLLDSVDEIVIGGALAYPFLAVVNKMPMRKSLTDQAIEQQVQSVMALSAAKGVTIHLPEDIVVAATSDSTDVSVVSVDDEGGIPEDKMGFDIGERSQAKFAEIVARAKTIIMGGPMGFIEEKTFQAGTKAVLDAVSKRTESGATTVLAEHSIGALAKERQEDLEALPFTHITDMPVLKLMAGIPLPGLVRLEPGYKPKYEVKKKKRKRKRKKKKKKRFHQEETPRLNRRARIAAWLESTKDLKYRPPPKSKLPPLPELKKPAPPIKYTGAPPPGKSKPLETAIKLFKLRPWKAPPPPPLPPRKPPVPRLASLPRSKSHGPPMRSASEMPWSHKHKIGLAGIPGYTYFRPQTTPLPCISPLPKEKLPRVPSQVPVLARFDKDGNILVHVDGTQGDLPENAKIEVTLVRGYNHIINKKPIAPRVKLDNDYPTAPKLVPWPADYDPNAVDPDLPAPGRSPRLNTTLTQFPPVILRDFTIHGIPRDKFFRRVSPREMEPSAVADATEAKSVE